MTPGDLLADPAMALADSPWPRYRGGDEDAGRCTASELRPDCREGVTVNPGHKTAALLLLAVAAALAACDSQGGASANADSAPQDATAGSDVPERSDVAPDAVAPDTDATPDAVPDAADAGPDTADGTPDLPARPAGERVLAGKVYFFDVGPGPAVVLQEDVVGATVHLFEYPDVAVAVGADGRFRLEGLPDGVPLTVAAEHPDYFPSLTRTFVLDGADLADVNFQAMSILITALGAEIVGVDPFAPGVCQMATTITAISPNQGSVWAVGEPGALAILDPPVAPEFGPTYFNTSVIPEPGLDQSTADGGVVVAGAPPGIYAWTATKPGFVFDTITMRCEPGWLTNAAPPYGVQAVSRP